MRKPEARLWDGLRANFIRPGDRLDRIENSLSSGAPDTNGCLEGEDVWMELKAPREPVRATTPLMTSNGNHPLLESQIGWMIRQKQAGGIAFILVRTETALMLLEGTRVHDEFNAMTLAEMKAASLIHFKVPTAKNDWRLLRNVIYTAVRHRRLHQHASAQQLLADMERKNLAGGGKS